YIPRSFIGPHRVKETNKFHFRNSNGKHEMSVDELRIAFNLLENLTDRVRKFSKERINLLASNDYHEDIPVMLGEGPRIALHSIPLTTLSLGMKWPPDIGHGAKCSIIVQERKGHMSERRKFSPEFKSQVVLQLL